MIPFTKIEATGNDFILIDFVKEKSLFKGMSENTLKLLYQKMSDRHFGVGADQILLLSLSEEGIFQCRFINADGSESEMCGNALRAVGTYLKKFHLSNQLPNQLPNQNQIFLKTLAGTQNLLWEDNVWKTTLTLPNVFESDEKLNAFDRTLSFRRVSMGNPHAVFFNLFLNHGPSSEELKVLGSFVERHPLFPNRTNVEFVNVLSRSEIEVKVWERGAGETLSCGSGACASVAAGIKKGILDRKVNVRMPGGTVNVFWESDEALAVLSGPVNIVFSGYFLFQHPSEDL